MPIQILMPALSPTMEEGKLARWLVKEGDKVTSGKVIAEIETDKATMEVEAVDEGTIGRLLVADGTEKVRVNMPIAILLEEGESAASMANMTAPQAALATGTSTGGAPGAQPAPREPAAPASSAGTTSNDHTAHDGARTFASPLARRLAKDAQINLSLLKGSGPHGRIVKADIEAALKNGVPRGQGALSQTGGQAVATTMQPGGAKSPAMAATSVAPMADDKILALYEPGTYDVLPHDGMRRIIAQRLTQSKQTIPHFYLNIDCRLDALLAARERMNKASPKDGPRAFKLSVNDFIIKALALALQQVPGANASWTEGGMLRHKYSDVGVAVAIPGGLFTPVIRHAEVKSLSEISNEMRDLADRARKRRLKPQEYQGGSTSISNLGMFGISSFDAVINPPHATILAVGAGEKRAVVAGDRIEAATMMSCTLSCDHRVVDGALGAELLNAFKAFIEDPVRMLV